MHFRQIPASRVDSFGWWTRIDVLSSLRRHTWAAALIALSTLALGVALWRMHRPVYTATSVVDVPPGFASATAAERYPPKPYPLYLDEQIRSLTSDSVLRKAVQRLKPSAWVRPGEHLESAVARLRASLLVNREPESYHQIEVSLSGKSPEHLAEIVNTVTSTYLEQVANERSESAYLASAASTPASAEPSYTRFLLPLLLPFALVAMVVGVVLIDLADDRVHSRNDVEKAMGFAPMGALLNDRDVTTETFRRSSMRLAAGIDQLVRTSGVRTIVLTPATAGGTSIAKPLGNMLARLGRNTLAIDSTGATPPVVYVPFDLNHSAHRELGGRPLPRAIGEAGSTQVIAQPFAPSVTPLSNFIQEAFEGQATNYDLVLVDAAPILCDQETEHMARFADVTVLVAEAGHTTRAQLVHASRLLQQLPIRGMATILNKVASSRAETSDV